MSKKWAIILVVLGEALIYLFIFVGVPALEALTYPSCQAVSDFEPPIFLKITPGLVGALVIAVILLSKKRKAKSEKT